MKTKNLKIAAVLVMAVTFMSFTALIEKNVDVTESTVNWKGYKVTGEHEGTIKLKEGTLMFDGESLVGGNFVMDMTSINTTDLEGEYKGKLDGHLKSADFFGVEKHPTANLKITNVEGNNGKYNVKADLTIKNITQPVEFTMYTKENSASAFVKIDRTKFDIKYGSSSFFDDLKDKAIYDEFDLNVNLKF
ncbi:YceI family protein [Winogradskyella aurantia]|uniref:Lipid-binding protein n=1 Tax=Winogradskyella aurantia TaxID=1915063 RepID=A0A265UUT2_9FLAO|nr:YceI family protein [Winogradskyella aurantia]OZV69068.1 lipid-binding protein [Winogradskyella aurantia]